MEYDLDTFLNWCAGATREERGFFLRRCLDNLPDEELVTVINLVGNAKKRRARRRGASLKKPKLLEPALTAVKPVPEAKPTEWWRKFKPSQAFAIDVEKVEVKNPHRGKPKYFQLAGEVAVVNAKREVVYREKIRREPGSFRVNKFAKNGFTSSSLQYGKELCQVQEELGKLLDGNLVIGVALPGDLDSLGMTTQDFEIFDLQWHWYREVPNSDGVVVREPLGLKSLYKHFFDIIIQPEGKIHTCAEDAQFTMDLFRHVYIKTGATTKANSEPSNEIEHFRS